jgi:hypothetical protein
MRSEANGQRGRLRRRRRLAMLFVAVALLASVAAPAASAASWYGGAEASWGRALLFTPPPRFPRSCHERGALLRKRPRSSPFRPRNRRVPLSGELRGPTDKGGGTITRTGLG